MGYGINRFYKILLFGLIIVSLINQSKQQDATEAPPAGGAGGAGGGDAPAGGGDDAAAGGDGGTTAKSAAMNLYTLDCITSALLLSVYTVKFMVDRYTA